MSKRTEIAKKLAEALAKGRAEEVADPAATAEEVEAKAETEEAQPETAPIEPEETGDTPASDPAPKDEPKAESDEGVMTQALSRIEALAGQVSEANKTVSELKAGNAEVKAESSKLSLELTEAQTEATSLKEMAQSLLQVFDIRLGNPAVDRSNLTASELVTAYASSEEQFDKAFPSSQASDTSEDENLTDAGAGHGQTSGFPISRKMSPRRT